MKVLIVGGREHGTWVELDSLPRDGTVSFERTGRPVTVEHFKPVRFESPDRPPIIALVFVRVPVSNRAWYFNNALEMATGDARPGV